MYVIGVLEMTLMLVLVVVDQVLLSRLALEMSFPKRALARLRARITLEMTLPKL